MTVKSPKPGRYTPKCARCGKTFALTVSDDTGHPMTAAPLASSPKLPGPKSETKPALPARPTPPPAKTAPAPKPGSEKHSPPRPKAPPPPEPAADEPGPNLEGTLQGGTGEADKGDFSGSGPASNLAETRSGDASAEDD